jgi:hypothetical protein
MATVRNHQRRNSRRTDHHQPGSLFTAGGHGKQLLRTEGRCRHVPDHIRVVAARLKEAIGNAILSPEGAGTNGMKVQLNAAAVVDLAEPFLFGADDIEEGHANSTTTDSDDGLDAIVGLPGLSGKRNRFDSQLEVTELFRHDLKAELVFFGNRCWSELNDGASFVREWYWFKRSSLAITETGAVFEEDSDGHRLTCGGRLLRVGC